MNVRSRWHVALPAVCLFSLACASPRPAETPPGSAEDATSSDPVDERPASAATSAQSSEQERTDVGTEAREQEQPDVSGPGEVTSEPAPGSWIEDGRAPDPKRGLPRISTRHIGMHLGGESNTDDAKRPWLKAIESQELRLLKCYRYVTSPLSGGTVGVDLYVGTGGGQPQVRKTRQRLGGPDFDECIREAFGAVRFPAPRRPIVISYSLRYDVQS
jgi:hypothetical protein